MKIKFENNWTTAGDNDKFNANEQADFEKYVNYVLNTFNYDDSYECIIKQSDRYKGYDLVTTIEKDGVEVKKIVIELKTRNQLYDDLMLEEKKVKSLAEAYLELNATNAQYINFIGDDCYVFELKNLTHKDIRTEIRNNPTTTVNWNGRYRTVKCYFIPLHLMEKVQINK